MLALEQARNLERYTELGSKAAANPILLLDEDWIYDMTIVLSELDAASQTFIWLQAPPSASEVRALVEASAQNMGVSVELITEGLANADASALEASEKYMTQAQDEILRAGSAMENFC